MSLHDGGVVDVVYPVSGDAVHSGYPYVLFSALCYRHPIKGNQAIRADPLEGVHPIGGGMLGINDGASIRVRSPSDCLSFLPRWSGEELMLGNHRIRLGKPTVRTIKPSAVLHANMVTYSLSDWSTYAERLVGDVGRFGGCIHIGKSRQLHAGRHAYRGYSVQISGLTEKASVALQCEPIGGRRRMCAGMFIPGELPKGLA